MVEMCGKERTLSNIEGRWEEREGERGGKGREGERGKEGFSEEGK